MTGWGARAVSVSYQTAAALDDVSLLVPAGQVTVVAGGDGAGKTTLLRCLAGALAPDRGEVRIPGRARIGYLPAGAGLYPDLTVAENLAFRASAYGLPAGVARDRAADLTARSGLAGARDRLAAQLSGGMRQKLGVIAALLHQPDLLVLDEPTTGVDPVSRAGLWRLIAGAAASGAAVVVATTYLDEAERAGSVLVLEGGRALGTGTPDEIVAAMAGEIVAARGPAARSWRRAGQWRTWVPPGQPRPDGAVVRPDLEDAVTVAELAGQGQEPAPEPQLSLTGSRWPGALAECTAVSRRFGQATAVREVSLRVDGGEIVGLLGANGAGKTTLIRMLLGLLPATSGTVALFGQPPSRETRRRLGYVPQGLGLYDDLTVAENLEFSAAVFGVPAGPADRSPVPVGRLPLGLQRRAAFAQALAHRPELLVLDEPTSGVDPLGRARLWDTVRSAAEAGAGVLVTTHYMEEASECDRLVIMADGAVVAEGSPAAVTGDATVTVVRTPAWPTAFGRLEERGFAVGLDGHSLRLPNAGVAAVRQALTGLEARVETAPATLEERFFQLVQSAEEASERSASAPPAR
jgi:ABC-2 type transport system ATP-binding protein